MENNITDQVMKIITDAEEGIANPLDSYIMLKMHKDAVEDALKQLKPLALSEAQRYGKGEHNHPLNVKFQVKQGGGRYDFSNVTAHSEILKQLKRIEDLAKQAYKQNTPLVIQDTGEFIEIPNFKSNEDSIAMTKI